MTACRSCSSRILWAKTTSGKLIAVDAEPDSDWDQPILDPDGTLAPTGRQVPAKRGSVPEVQVVAAGANELALVGESRRRWRPHFATCPDASEWRR